MKRFLDYLLIIALGSSISLHVKAQSIADSSKLGKLSLGKIRMNRHTPSENRLSVFPNPASKTTEIRLNTPDNLGFNLELYDSAGLRILHQEWKGGLLDVSAYPPGIYLISLKRKDEVYSQKLIIER